MGSLSGAKVVDLGSGLDIVAEDVYGEEMGKEGEMLGAVDVS